LPLLAVADVVVAVEERGENRGQSSNNFMAPDNMAASAHHKPRVSMKRQRAETPDCRIFSFPQVHCPYTETICRLRTIAFGGRETFG
jgi:hypothetical protein